MNILVLTKKMPYPKRDGESIAIDMLCDGLQAEGADLDLLAMNTSKHFSAFSGDNKESHPFSSIDSTKVDNRIKVKDAFLNLFSSESYHISRFVSDDFRAKLIEKLREKEYDVIQLETLYLCPYIETIREYSDAKIVLRAHNVEHEIWERVGSNESNVLKKIYLKYLSHKLKRFEINVLNQIDLLLPISKRDAQQFVAMGCDRPLQVIPIGVKFKEEDQSELVYRNPISFGFIGSLDWIPNLEGLTWFIDQVWKPFYDEHPEVQFNIAGRNTPDWLQSAKWPGVNIHGEVESAAEFTKLNEVMIVPLLSGSGMRAKILEALALGRNLITTSVGIEGIEADDLNAVYIADKAEDFRAHLKTLVGLNGEVKRDGTIASQVISKKYNHREVASALYQRYQNYYAEL